MVMNTALIQFKSQALLITNYHFFQLFT